MIKFVLLTLLVGEGLSFSNWRTWVDDFQGQLDDFGDEFDEIHQQITRSSQQLLNNNPFSALPDMLGDMNMPDFSSIGPAISRRLPKINYDLSAIKPMIPSGMPAIDYNFWRRMGDPRDPEFWRKFGVPGSPFNGFKSARPWWEGENVCVDKQILEPENLLGFSVTGSLDPSSMLKMFKCEATEDVYMCEQLAYIDGEKKGVKTTFSCCHGYKLVAEGYQKQCKEVDIRPTEETIADLEGTDFLTMFSEENLLDHLSNATVFMPDNEAIQNFLKGMSDLSPIPGENGAISYTIDEGLLKKRRKRQIDLIVDQGLATKEILLNHLVPEVLNVQDFSNNDLITSKSSEGATIRMSVYPTLPVKTVLANCALITSKNHHTTTGVVHVVDKVIQPATQTIGEILAEDLQFKTFMSSLDEDDSRKLSDNKQTLTVFVPSEKAFQELDEETSAKLFGSGSCGNHILRSHILPEIVCSGVIMGRVQVTNSMGDKLNLRRADDGSIFVNEIKLVLKDMVATNGVIHVIDSIIVPKSSKTVEEEVKARNSKEFAELIQESKLWEKLNGLENFTLLLPSRQAMREIAPEMLQILKQDSKQLEQLILHHILPSKHQVCARTNSVIKSLAGQPHHSNFPHSVSCARIEPNEAKVCGGNVYTVDRLLVHSMTNLLDTLEKSEEHSTFFKLIKDLNLRDQISGVHTIFAPTNRAFQQLQAETQHRIFGDKEMMKKVVENHIIPDAAVCCSSAPRNMFAFKQFARGERTLGGQTLFLRRSHTGNVLVNSHASVERCDTVAEDGIIHSIDSVLMPRELKVPPMRNFQFWEF